MLRRSSAASCRHERWFRRRISLLMSVQVCPGCQGRNSSRSELCEWCGRSFDGRQRGFALRWWHLAVILLFGFVVLAAGSLAFLSANRQDLLRPRVAASPTSLSLEPTLLPTRAATAGLTLGTPKPVFSPVASATPIPPPPEAATEPSPAAPNRYARIFNTGGVGVFLREEPGPQGQRVVPAVAEGAVLRLVGPEQTIQAQIWRLCEHEARGVQGWVLTQYLQPVDITPTPARP